MKAEEVYDWPKTLKMIETITKKLEDPNRMYSHDWEEGDFAIIDNLAIGHYAHPDT